MQSLVFIYCVGYKLKKSYVFENKSIQHKKILNTYVLFVVSVISKIDRKIILEKYNKTCLIEANGGQMIKVRK